MPDLDWFDLLKNEWPNLPAPCQLHDVTQLVGFPVSNFLDALKAGKMLYSPPFPTLHSDTAQLAVGKYPKAPPFQFKLFVKLTHRLTCQAIPEQHSEGCSEEYHLKFIECAFEFRKGGAYSVLSKYFVLSQTESIYVSDDITYPEALASSKELYGSEYFRVRFVYDNSCKNVVEANFPSKSDAQVPESFVKNLASLLASGDGSDITFKFTDEDDGVPAHKALLVAQSNVFKTSFQKLRQPSEQSSYVLIHDFTKEEFQLFLQYVYTGQLPLGETVEKYLAVLRAAHKYQVLGLIEYVSTIVGDRLDVMNVTDVLIQADMYGADKLVDKAVKYVVENAQQTVQRTMTALRNRPKLAEILMCALINKL